MSPLPLRRARRTATVEMALWPALPMPPRQDSETAAFHRGTRSLDPGVPNNLLNGLMRPGCRSASGRRSRAPGCERRPEPRSTRCGESARARTEVQADLQRDRVAAQAFHTSDGPWYTTRLHWLRPSCRGLLLPITPPFLPAFLRSFRALEFATAEHSRGAWPGRGARLPGGAAGDQHQRPSVSGTAATRARAPTHARRLHHSTGLRP